jgi:acetyl-CoA acetyltransferase
VARIPTPISTADMAAGRAVPVIIGVGDIKNKSLKLEDAIEPMHLMVQAILKALEDTALSSSAIKELQSKVDSVDIVATWTWPYHDLPSLLSENLGIDPQHKFYTEHGGNQPAKLLDEAARRISLRESKVAIITGGESLASRTYSSPHTGRNADYTANS